MPPFKVMKKAVTPFGHGIDGIVGKIDKQDHGKKFGKPTIPRKRRTF